MTIDGIRHVVDGGVARARAAMRARYRHPLHEPTSRASADQRKGRAGRTAFGDCWRLDGERAPEPAERNTPRSSAATPRKWCCRCTRSHRRAANPTGSTSPTRAVRRAEKLLVMLGALGLRMRMTLPSRDNKPVNRKSNQILLT